ncbi:MAG: GNAT family N-acetyltransferase [Chlorobiaceae bacterium]|nr:GNAT family N-acetyltransferase [Chlorobiaceae bacterium]
MSSVAVSKVMTPEERADAMSVIDEVFVREKRWIAGSQEQIPEDPGADARCSWFLARVGGKPAGVMRLYYDPSFDIPEAFQVSLEPGVDIEEVKSSGSYAEIGRFMILPQYRRQYLVALRLMRAATAEVVERGYTHFITDVFESDAHSPLNFHTRVLGFEVIGRHLFGELDCSSTRIILTLDILKLYNRVKDSRSRIYQELVEGLRTSSGKRLSLSGGID